MLEEGKLIEVLTELVEKNNIILEEVEKDKKYPAKTRIFGWNDCVVIQIRKEDDPDDFWEIVDPVDVEEYILGKKFELMQWEENYPPTPWKEL